MSKKLRQENFSKSKSLNLLKTVFHLKWVKKLLSKSFFLQVHFGSRTVVHLFVDVDICDAAAQSLAMTNIASFSLVDAEAGRIRINFQVFHFCAKGSRPKRDLFFWESFPKYGRVGWLIPKQGLTPSNLPKSP